MMVKCNQIKDAQIVGAIKLQFNSWKWAKSLLLISEYIIEYIERMFIELKCDVVQLGWVFSGI
jgi:hypothetical protein